MMRDITMTITDFGRFGYTNDKYPLDEKDFKDNKKGAKRAANRTSVSVPVIEDFEENELKEAGYFIKEEFQFLRLALGHENESLDEFVEAHKTCLNDIMYFPTRNGYGLSSVAGNIEKLAALQNEFENVKKRMDDDTKKAQRLEQKIKLLTNGYQDMDADGVVENATPVVDVSSSDIMPSVSADAATQLKSVDENHSSDIPNQKFLCRMLMDTDPM
ncbi:Cell division cycle 5-like protein [Camellia lanceoleosa]|uniref:Cell division cycle 5-like protein n=1 Tax=Camellia lanceoleosa TaxID=1840588 RepID=A0ACC0G6Y8_9ERIC|nr:Cell division cycle 5-like protein [Camellia lanceoleosa]